MPGRNRHGVDEADLVLLELLRLATWEDLPPAHAGRRLLDRRYHRGALVVARSRLLRAAVTRPSPVAAAATDIVEAALRQDAAPADGRLRTRQAI